jgi:hypothetical protein
MKFLEKFPLCEKIPHKKSYLDILNDNQDIDGLRFLVFLTVESYLMIFSDTNLAVDSLVPKESKCFGISRLYLTVYEIKKHFLVFIFNSARQQRKALMVHMHEIL